MTKKDKDTILDEHEKLKSEIIHDRVNEIFRNYRKDYIAKIEEISFKYFDDNEDSEELEERDAKPENKRQRNLVAYFENRCKLTDEIFGSYSAEKVSTNPNYPLLRKYFKKANKNLRQLILYGLDNHPGRFDLLSDLAFFHEFQNILSILICYYTKVCVDQENLDTFTELARDFYYCTKPDGYDAYYALRELFDPNSDKRKIIDFLIADEKEDEKENSQTIEF